MKFQGLQSLMGNKPDSAMRIDPDGKRLQIDDLIIIPNNLHSPPEGGSALKSLAQIASRYQSSTGQPMDVSSPKKARLDDAKSSGGTVLPSAASPALPTSALNLGHGASPGLSTSQQSLFSVFPPGLIPGTWPPSSGIPPSKTSTNTTNSTSTKLSTSSSSSSSAAMNSALALAAAAAAAGLSNFPLSQDPSKMGPDGYTQLIQLYEKHLKSAANTAAAPTSIPTVKSVTAGLNGSKKETAPAAATLSQKDKDRHKVSKPPPDTKRPPRLMQTPCAFVQTNHIYTNPMVELNKAKEAVAAATAQAAAREKLPIGAGTIDSQMGRTATTSILDLSSHRRPPKSEPQTGLLNLKKESALLANPHSSASSINLMGLSMKREGMSSSSMSHPLGFTGSGSSVTTGSPSSVLKHELKSSPFSAESLLSKTSSSSSNANKSSSYSSHLQHSMSDLVKMSGERSKQDSAMSRLSPAAPMSSLPRTSPAPRSSPFATSHSPHSSGPDKSRSSPWHTPVSHGGNSAGQKPAIPVSPVVRESESAKKDSMSSFQSALFGLSYPPATTSSGGMSISMPPTTFSLSPSASSLAAAQQSFAAAAAANPYLALMSMGGGMSQASASSQMSKSFGSPHLMDPATSAYYAALYSQQMYGLSPYLGLGGGLRPGMGAPSSSSNSSQAAASALAAAAGLDPLQASALQAMLSRGGGSAPSPTSPFGAFPGGLSGFPGYPSFPPQSGRKDS